MGEIHVLETERGLCKQSVVEMLEEALRQARDDDDVVAVAIAVVRPDGAVNGCFSQSDVGPTLLGALEMLKGRLVRFLGEES